MTPDQCPHDLIAFCTETCMKYASCGFGGADGVDCRSETANACGAKCSALMEPEAMKCVCDLPAAKMCADKCSGCVHCITDPTGPGCEACYKCKD